MIIFTPNSVIKSADMNTNFAESIDNTKHTNLYKFSVCRSTNQTGIADATVTTIQFNQENFDTNNNFDTSTYKYTVPLTGYYFLSLIARITGTGITLYNLYITKNVNTTIITSKQAEATSGDRTQTICGLVYLTAGDTVYGQLYSDVSSGTTTIIGEVDNCNFTGFFVSQ